MTTPKEYDQMTEAERDAYDKEQRKREEAEQAGNYQYFILLVYNSFNYLKFKISLIRNLKLIKICIFLKNLFIIYNWK